MGDQIMVQLDAEHLDDNRLVLLGETLENTGLESDEDFYVSQDVCWIKKEKFDFARMGIFSNFGIDEL